MLYDRNSHLYEPIFQNPSVIPLMYRFGISLGTGDASIGSACACLGIDEIFFLDIINTYLNETYNPQHPSLCDSTESILEYLEKTDFYYRDVQLPNVENHLNLLIGKSNNNNGNLNLLKGFFQEVKEEFTKLIFNDTEIWIPFLRKILKSGDEEQRKSLFQAFISDTERKSPFDNSQLGEKLTDLLAFFTIHLHGDYNRNLCVAVVTAIFTLEKDVRQNARIRKKIFLPAVANIVGGIDVLDDML